MNLIEGREGSPKTAGGIVRMTTGKRNCNKVARIGVLVELMQASREVIS